MRRGIEIGMEIESYIEELVGNEDSPVNEKIEDLENIKKDIEDKIKELKDEGSSHVHD